MNGGGKVGAVGTVDSVGAVGAVGTIIVVVVGPAVGTVSWQFTKTVKRAKKKQTFLIFSQFLTLN